jgi:hypothetical protein
LAQVKLDGASITTLDAVYKKRDADLSGAWNQKVGA